MTHPLTKRAMKLGVLMIGVGAALGLVSIFLPTNLQRFTWGTIAGLLAAFIFFLERWFRKGVEPADTMGQLVIALLVVIALSALTHFFPEHVWWTHGGIAVGFVATIALIASPLFYEPAPPR
jgi:hypothetical protein